MAEDPPQYSTSFDSANSFHTRAPPEGSTHDPLAGDSGFFGFAIAPFLRLLVKPWQFPHTWVVLLGFAITELVISLRYDVDMQWHWFALYACTFLMVAEPTLNAASFFRGFLSKDVRPFYAFIFITTSTFVSWIYASGLTFAVQAGFQHGIVGTFGVACYYIAFLSVGLIGYLLRRVRWYESLPQAIYERYGLIACLLFLCTVIYRLENEIWMNALAAANFYAPQHTKAWWLAVCLAIGIPMVASLWGGMRATLISGILQFFAHIAFLIVVLVTLGDRIGSTSDWGTTNASWTMNGGVDFIIIALVQGFFSYPWFDPVLTDRAFLGPPGTMLISYIISGLLSGGFVLLFGFIGIYAASQGQSSGSVVDISRSAGTLVFTFTNMIILTSCMSVLSATFTSAAKVFGLEFVGCIKDKPWSWHEAGTANMQVGRLGIIIIAVAGVVPLITTISSLNQTLISGTVILGLGPPLWFLPFIRGQRPLTFILPFCWGVGLGIAQQIKPETWDFWKIGNSPYANLLGTNVYGEIIAFGLAFIGLIWNSEKTKDSDTRDKVVPQQVTLHEEGGEDVMHVGGGGSQPFGEPMVQDFEGGGGEEVELAPRDKGEEHISWHGGKTW